MPIAHRVTAHGSRGSDLFGSGQYDASRDGGTRHHRGLDIVADPHEMVMSPIDGEVLREAAPYPDDPRYTGVVIRGTGAWSGYEVKIFYARGIVSGTVTAGQPVGMAQNVGEKYPGITNHVHVEVRRDGNLISPSEIFGACY